MSLFRNRSFEVSMRSNWSTHLTIICLKTRRRSPSVVRVLGLDWSLWGDSGAGKRETPLASSSISDNQVRLRLIETITSVCFSCVSGGINFNTQTFVKELIRGRGPKQSNKCSRYLLPTSRIQLVHVVLDELLQTGSTNTRQSVIFFQIYLM